MTMLLLSLCMLGFQLALSQSEGPGVKVQARATQHSVKLRWAPNAPATWELANRYGYTIERIKLSENGKIIEHGEKVKLNQGVIIKPAIQIFWEPFMDEDDYVAVAAQAIYGETFELTEPDKSDIVKVVNKAKELESRFSFTLFASDQSIKAAELSGLYFEDKTLSPDAKYLYKIYANIPVEIQKVDTGFVFIGIVDYKPLPKPADLKATFEDQTAILSWNGILHEKIYSSFWVERSDDNGKSFKKISERPIINAFSGDRPKSQQIFRLDSLPANGVRYYYRVLGINSFGETGPPSDTVSGIGKPVFAYSATITGHEITKDGKASLTWTFPENGGHLLRSFDLLRVNQTTKKQTTIRQNIDKGARTVTDETPSSTNYYVIRAVDKFGRTNNSLPYLVQTEDSIPPSQPLALKGHIDTLGHVYIEWKPNTEEDLHGYSLFRANFSTDDFIVKPGPIISTNFYVDTIRLNNLTEKLYYKVRAIDKRFNASEFSAVLVLEKPDKMPPVPPVFRSIASDTSGILISWNNSSSEDVVDHLLYRKAENEKEWTFVKSFPRADTTTTTHHDEGVTHKVEYAYTVLAIDDDGLESIPAQPVSTTFVKADPYPMVEDLYFSLNQDKKQLTVSWKYSYGAIDKFLIYKSTNNLPPVLFRSVEHDVHEIKDHYSLNDSVIEYRIVVSFKSGERTRTSKPLIIKM